MHRYFHQKYHRVAPALKSNIKKTQISGTVDLSDISYVYHKITIEWPLNTWPLGYWPLEMLYALLSALTLRPMHPLVWTVSGLWLTSEWRFLGYALCVMHAVTPCPLPSNLSNLELWICIFSCFHLFRAFVLIFFSPSLTSALNSIIMAYFCGWTAL